MFEKIKEKIALKSDPESPRYRRFMAQRVCGHHIKYVTERENDIDKVIGREGGINIRDDVLTDHEPVLEALYRHAANDVMIVLVARHHESDRMAGIFLQFRTQYRIADRFQKTELTVGDMNAADVL